MCVGKIKLECYFIFYLRPFSLPLTVIFPLMFLFPLFVLVHDPIRRAKLSCQDLTVSGSRNIRECFMLCFHGGSCHCMCLPVGYVWNVGGFLILALPSGMVNVISARVTIE